ncbi:MAG TPA: DNA ligase D, partial [Vicinamibacteria bacterium]
PRAAGVHWVRPELVAEVAFGEWTADGKMRHPSFKGLRGDKPATEVVKEAPVEGRGSRVESQAGLAGVRITHGERVVYPDDGITKLDVARFYEKIADWVVPHLRGRPTTLVRCPDGLGGKCFYQKHTGHWAPDTLKRVRIQEAKKVGEYLVVEDLAGLIGLVQIGILEVHTWNSTLDRLEQPDRLVFDLDPDEGLPWERTVEAARTVRAALEALDLVSFLKTTGGKGLHVVAPLQPGPDWDEVGRFAEALAVKLAGADPDRYVATMAKAKRRGKVFIDYLRNHRGATSISPYSTRAKPGAPVSLPIAWDELTPKLRPEAFTLKTVPARLESRREDPWAEYGKVRQRLTPQRLRAVAK